ncbi:MAG TPA: ABC transporter permease [Chloroflexus aurantiacus]|uniref:Transport permease protein n=1 Tax=Chloroflexus aurantiacus (strain ATCC 29366 / DSM 635 / J-10-fl) TaxID=324602 RepID=A9WCG4_CHLAA|nr:ABC transporter permease [Chloroflexus aurantiacus]ABY34955.1 ABC-2 type transporter [Chloroflexus aurantiacus J-10-fl]RMG46041.1 MAG: ABC transporter permease [Chloroflexota bacterium]HBW68280.1 ABC transporter permease [Chloroflexus aurantiacus]
MANTIKQPLNRATGWRAIGDLLTRQRGALRLYQWLWLVLCIVGALSIALPPILTRPIIYYANAVVRFDMARYGPIYQPVGPNLTGMDIAIADATEALRLSTLARADVRFGLPNFRVEYLLQQPGEVLVRGVADNATEAKLLADAGAAELVRQIRAAGGREILRNMLGWQLWQALNGTTPPADDRFALLLRDILRLEALPLSRPIEPFSTPRTLSDLSGEEISDVARALESRYDLWRFAINTRNATLDALCGSAGLTDTATREATLRDCAATNPSAAAELAARDRTIAQLRSIEAALTYMIREAGARFNADQESAAFRIPAALPAAPEPRYEIPLTALAILFGTALGLGGIALDRSAGVLPKLQELWQYRELIRNLILRDLRARYKGSALGYLWTQIAPLGMMLVYVIVFSFLLPNGLAMFPVFVIVGLLPWNYTAEAVLSGTRSIIDNAALVKKVYFPREVLPLVAVGSSLLNFILSLPMMALVIIVVQLATLGRLNLSWSIVYLPVIMALQTIFLAGLALLLGAGAVFFRDVVHLIGIVINIWFFLTPIIYPLSTISEGLAARLIRWFNPLASIIEFYREIIYGNPVPVGLIPTPGVPALSAMLRVGLTGLIILAFGYWVFQRTSRHFGEEL